MDSVETRGGDVQNNYYNIQKAIIAELLEMPQNKALAVRYQHGSLVFFDSMVHQGLSITARSLTFRQHHTSEASCIFGAFAFEKKASPGWTEGRDGNAWAGTAIEGIYPRTGMEIDGWNGVHAYDATTS